MGVARVDVLSVDNDRTPLGDVTLAPSGLTGVSEAHLAQAMVAQALARSSKFDETTLKGLRSVFRHSPLAFRLGAIAALMRR
jgi:hypothetical protein